MADALTWTYYLLSQNKEVEAKLHSEVDLIPRKGANTACANAGNRTNLCRVDAALSSCMSGRTPSHP